SSVKEQLRLCGEVGRPLDLDPVAGVRKHVEPGVRKVLGQVIAGRYREHAVFTAVQYEDLMADGCQLVLAVFDWSVLGVERRQVRAAHVVAGGQREPGLRDLLKLAGEETCVVDEPYEEVGHGLGRRVLVE